MKRREFLRQSFKNTASYALLPAVMLSSQSAFAGKKPKKSTSTSELTDTEIEHLMLMREEEKLARDVYITMYDTWGLNVFATISESEQVHTDAVENLILKYNLADPVENENEIGNFTDPALQELYDTLILRGEESEIEALYVAVYIEELDISDLLQAIGDATHSDIIQTYENLMSGSESHLRAFHRQLESYGISGYTADILEPELIESILADTVVGKRGR